MSKVRSYPHDSALRCCKLSGSYHHTVIEHTNTRTSRLRAVERCVGGYVKHAHPATEGRECADPWRIAVLGARRIGARLGRRVGAPTAGGHRRPTRRERRISPGRAGASVPSAAAPMGASCECRATRALARPKPIPLVPPIARTGARHAARPRPACQENAQASESLLRRMELEAPSG